MTTVRLSDDSPTTLDVETLIVATHTSDRGVRLAPSAAAVDAAFSRKLAAALSAVGATGKTGEVVRIPTFGAIVAPAIVAVGLGAPGRTGAEELRRAAGAAVRTLAGQRKVGLVLPIGTDEALTAVAEGAHLGAYAFRAYRHTSLADHPAPVAAVTLVGRAADTATRAALRRAAVVGGAVALVRDLVNTPAGDLHPADLAASAQRAVATLPVDVTVLDEKALRRGGYGGLIGVGQGSVHPPRLVRMAYAHPRATRTVALVGKGITFDSGGLSLKPPASMETMKDDMAGAAAVLATMQAVATLRPSVNVIGYLACAENMPSGTATRPSDILTIYGGTKVEVLNTDAEGRLVLADALVRAGEDSPDAIIDVATLTGAQQVALGNRTAAVMSNDDGLRSRIVRAADRAGESMWPMPLPEELRRSIDSEIADLANMGDRYGGMMVGGLFLREFVPAGTPWAHLDIAGPAYNADKPYGYTPAGGTGHPVRTLLALVEDTAAT